MPTAEALGLVEEQIAVLAGQIRASIRDAALAVDPNLPPFGLRLLRLLERCGPTHAGAVAELLFVDRSAVSRQARQLEDLGLVESRPDASDGRARILALTAAGVERMRTTGPAGKLRMHRNLSAWPEADLRAFARYLERLTLDE
ncbi:winged helix-turn-helix transcriptional regulator [Microbacteriaceae bacterium VKM Ac-2854]|nr:winged helix-turn-helix transcriptional regulator [Microbacteriaceae bacterium VKM Ac-2854]